MQSLALFAMVAVVSLFAVTLMPASQQASAAHHKVHTAYQSIHNNSLTASKGRISVQKEDHSLPIRQYILAIP